MQGSRAAAASGERLSFSLATIEFVTWVRERERGRGRGRGRGRLRLRVQGLGMGSGSSARG
jgi:hypothetical protein